MAGTPSVNNAGLWKKSAGAGNFVIGVAFSNTGTTDGQAGQLSLPNIQFNHGTLRVSTGGRLNLGGTSLDNMGGLIETLSASTVHVNDTSTILGGGFNNVGGTFDFGSNVTLDGTVAGGTTFGGIFNIPVNRTVTDSSQVRLVVRHVGRAGPAPAFRWDQFRLERIAG